MSTILEEIEHSYYKAIHTIKVTELEESDTRQGSVRYDREAFLQWARNIDFSNLSKDKADFSLDKETVDRFLKYRGEVQAELRKSFQYVQYPNAGITLRGNFKSIGSCHDGSKVGKMDEVDSFYVLEGDNIVVEPAGPFGVYRVYWKNGSTKFEIEARSIRNQFADVCDKIISELPLPTCLRHGGYNSPQHGGLRYNGPAATCQFLTKDNSLLTLDMTPTFRLPGNEDVYDCVEKLLDPICKATADKMFDQTDIHLIPDCAENLWRLSTAHLEANILRILPTAAPAKQALSYCKILLRKLKEWNAPNCIGFSSEMPDVFNRLMKELEEYREGSSKCKTMAQRLSKELRYAHIWVPPEKRKLYQEDQKSYISINNAAVKYILLSAALELPEAFSDKDNMDLVLKLMKHVFEVLGDSSRVSVPHTFLRMIDVPHLSILASQEKHKMSAGLLIKEQCRTLALETMSMVSIQSVLDKSSRQDSGIK